MKYPAFMKTINKWLANISGIMLIIIAVLSVFEAIMRGFFNSPTKWTLDLTCYLLLYAIFLGTAYAYQEKGHVAVDLLRDAIEKRFGKVPRRGMSIAGFILVFATVAALLYGALKLFTSAIKLGKLTTATLQVPIWIMYLVIIIGSVVALATVVFIILDLCSGSETYL